MPYPITESGGQYCVNGKCYDTRAEAEAYQAALYANVPEAEKSTPPPAFIFKQTNGLYRWNSISSNNIKDRDGETVQLKALQGDVARTKIFGDDSHLRFCHIPFDIGGAPDFRAIVDGMLVESGEFYDEPVANTIAQYAIDNPEGVDGSGWGTSIGFYGQPDDQASYDTSIIEERSLLPLSKAANSYTKFGVREKMLTPDQQQLLEKVVGDPALLAVVQTAIGAVQQSKQADADGAVRKAAKTTTPDVPVFNGPGKYDATPQAKLGFGAALPAQQKDATAIEAAAMDEAKLVAEATAASDAAMAAMNRTDAAIALTLAEGAVAVATAEATEPPAADTPAPAATPAAAPATPPAEVKATDTPAPDPAKTDKPATGSMSDEDMQGIAKFVNEAVQKAVSEAMVQMKGELDKVYGNMDKMQKTFSQDTQVKMINELPRSTYERLKAFGMTEAAAIKEGDQAFVKKGENLPAEPAPMDMLRSALGFGPQ